jgi:membrane protein implicated in regulation of membrane protease activity
MEELFSTFTHITWWLAGIILMVAEIFVGGTFLLWLGVAAIVVGSLMFFGVPLDWQLQLIVFSIVSVLSIILWRKVQKNNKDKVEDPNNPHLSRRGELYIGKKFTVVEPIVNGVGKVKVEDTLWRAKSNKDFKQGDKVTILSVEGASFIVGD